MHVPDTRARTSTPVEETNCLDFLGCAEVPQIVGNSIVDFGARSDVAYFSLRDDCRVDSFDRFNRFLGARNIRVER